MKKKNNKPCVQSSIDFNKSVNYNYWLKWKHKEHSGQLEKC